MIVYISVILVALITFFTSNLGPLSFFLMSLAKWRFIDFAYLLKNWALGFFFFFFLLFYVFPLWYLFPSFCWFWAFLVLNQVTYLSFFLFFVCEDILWWFYYILVINPIVGFPGGSRVNNLPAMQETWVWSPGREDSPEEGRATHFSILAWRIPWTEELGWLQSTGLQRVGHNWSDWAHTHMCIPNCIFSNGKWD